MKDNFIRVIEKLSSFGVLERSALKNNPTEVSILIRKGLLKKIHKKGKVFFELTPKSLSILENVRRRRREEASIQSLLHPRRRPFYEALLHDPRFVDPARKEAKQFLFLGDWQLHREPCLSQLWLSQHRFYTSRGLA